MKNFMLIVMILAMFFSCKKETANISGITGKWDWIASSGGIAGTTYTPASTGDRFIIEFTKDSIYRSYRNGTLSLECKYHLIKSTSHLNPGSNLLIKRDSISILQSFKIKSDTLVLFDECYDCFTSGYKRIE